MAQNAVLLRLGPLWDDHGFVFTKHTGGPLHINSLVSQYEKLTQNAGVPRIRFHELRHTSSSLLLAQDIHPKIVQKQIGHADIGMTLNRYSHVTPSMQREAAEALDKVGADAEAASRDGADDNRLDAG